MALRYRTVWMFLVVVTMWLPSGLAEQPKKAPKAEAEAAAAVAIALLKGEDLTGLSGGLTINNGTNDLPFVALEPIGVTKDNVAETVIADGFRTWEEICVGDFEQYCPADR